MENPFLRRNYRGRTGRRSEYGARRLPQPSPFPAALSPQRPPTTPCACSPDRPHRIWKTTRGTPRNRRARRRATAGRDRRIYFHNRLVSRQKLARHAEPDRRAPMRGSRDERFLEQVAIRDILVEGDAQRRGNIRRLAFPANRERRIRRAVTDRDHRRTQRGIALLEGVYFTRNLQAPRRKRCLGENRVGQRELATRLLIGHAAHIRPRRRIRAADTTLVHDALVLLLELDEHLVVLAGNAVAAHTELLLIEGLVQRSIDKRPVGRVEIAADYARRPIVVDGHAPFECRKHRMALSCIEAVLDFLALENFLIARHRKCLLLKRDGKPSLWRSCRRRRGADHRYRKGRRGKRMAPLADTPNATEHP